MTSKTYRGDCQRELRHGVEGGRVKTEYSELGNVFGPQGFGKRVEGHEDEGECVCVVGCGVVLMEML